MFLKVMCRIRNHMSSCPPWTLFLHADLPFLIANCLAARLQDILGLCSLLLVGHVAHSLWIKVVSWAAVGLSSIQYREQTGQLAPKLGVRSHLTHVPGSRRAVSTRSLP